MKSDFANHSTNHNCHKLYGFHVDCGFEILWGKKGSLECRCIMKNDVLARELCPSIFPIFVFLKDSHCYVCASHTTENVQ